MKRYKPKKEVSIATNTDEILSAIDTHVSNLPVKEPNQTHRHYWTYDISCNEDFALHYKYHEWQKIFEFFKNHDRAFASLATKIIPLAFLQYNPNQKIRIRFSLMPQIYSDILEPNTPPILDRIKAIDVFKNAGYDVHINYSPIIFQPDGLKYYRELFELVDKYVANKDNVYAECIMLTHNKQRHDYNMIHYPEAEDLLWNPEIQRDKISQFGGKNLRYEHSFKRELIQQFTSLHQEIINWNLIRYIF